VDHLASVSGSVLMTGSYSRKGKQTRLWNKQLCACLAFLSDAVVARQQWPSISDDNGEPDHVMNFISDDNGDTHQGWDVALT
jgi:hypothetical protein